MIITSTLEPCITKDAYPKLTKKIDSKILTFNKFLSWSPQYIYALPPKVSQCPLLANEELAINTSKLLTRVYNLNHSGLIPIPM